MICAPGSISQITSSSSPKPSSSIEERLTECCGTEFDSRLDETTSATTHWRRSETFRRAFPETNLQADRIYVRDGKFWTSAGITAGIDLALALIEEVAPRRAILTNLHTDLDYETLRRRLPPEAAG